MVNELLREKKYKKIIKTQVNRNDNTKRLETMKISTKPMSSKTVERSECQLVRSPNPEEPELVVPYKNPGKTKTQEESKLPLSISIKTDTKDSEIVKLCRSKRITCQDTIHEYDEDDGLTMEKVGR